MSKLSLLLITISIFLSGCSSPPPKPPEPKHDNYQAVNPKKIDYKHLSVYINN